MPMKPATVSIRKGDDQFALVECTPLRPAAKFCGRAGDMIRCLSVSCQHSVLTDLDAASLSVERRVDRLPVMHQIWFHRSGAALGYTQKQTAGDPSEIYFMTPVGALKADAILPNAVSDVAEALDGWYVACRNGYVYRYSIGGQRLWERQIQWRRPTPIASVFTGSTPPNLLLAGPSWHDWLVVANKHEFCMLTESGVEGWVSALPRRGFGQQEICVPSELPSPAESLRALGLGHAGRVALGFLRLTLDTSAAAEPNWAVRCPFRKSAQVSEYVGDKADVLSVDFEIGDETAGEQIRSVAAWRERVAIGTTDGRLLVFESKESSLLKTFYVGRGPVSNILTDGTRLQAVFGGGLLTLFHEDQVSGCVRLSCYDATLVLHDAGILVYDWHVAWLVDRRGRIVWKGEFSKRISGVVVDEVGFWVGAGSLFAFRSHPNVGQVRQRYR